MAIDTSNLEYGVKYDLTMHNGHIYKGWYVYSLECGYFLKRKERKQKALFILNQLHQYRNQTKTKPR